MTHGSDRWSFEFYPPKTEQGLINLYERIGRMTSLGPSFIGALDDLLDCCELRAFVRTSLLPLAGSLTTHRHHLGHVLKPSCPSLTTQAPAAQPLT